MIDDFLDRARTVGTPLVAAFIIDTQGSTYRKPGAFMLFDGADGRCGLLSGGCLEGDLHDHARALLSSDARCVERTYDSRGSDDPVWGLGLGCEGLMRVLLLRIDAEGGYAPVSTLRDAARQRRNIVVAIRVRDGAILTDATPQALQRDAMLDDGIFFVAAERTPTVLLCGAGPDAEPVCRLAVMLGWRVTVFDHRPAYVDVARFPGAERVLHADPDELAHQVPLEDFDAAIVMSHHLIADGKYLAALADTSIDYVGLLGPAARRERLYAELGPRAQSLKPRLRAPVGLDLGGRSPEEIALSIVAEVQAVLYERRKNQVLRRTPRVGSASSGFSGQ